MKKLMLMAFSAAAGMALAAPVVSTGGVKAELKTGATPLFESVGYGADALPLDWPVVAVEAEVTVDRNGRISIASITDTSAQTITVAVVPNVMKDEAKVTVTVRYLDANGCERKRDSATVYAVTGMNGADTRFSSADTSTAEWSEYYAVKPIVATLDSEDEVEFDSTAVPAGKTHSFYRQFGTKALGASVEAGLEGELGAFAASIVRRGKGFVISIN